MAEEKKGHHEHAHEHSEHHEHQEPHEHNEVRIDNDPDKKIDFSKIKKNPWMVTSLVLGVIVVVLLALVLRGGVGGSVSETSAVEKSLDLVKRAYDVNLTYVSASKENGIYIINTNYEGNPLILEASTDFKFIKLPGGWAPVSDIEEMIKLNGGNETETTSTEIPKTDKPKAELYIFSYCPAGTAALDTFAKAAKVLKNVADLKVKFFSNMHGEHEKQQNMIQECIQDVSKDKYWDYALQYVAKIYNVCGATRDIGCDKNESIKLMKSVGINSDSVMACVAQKGEKLYAQDQSDADKFGLGASPSMVVNDVSLGSSFDRSSEGIKIIICDSFNTAPKECEQTLGTTATTSAGSCG